MRIWPKNQRKKISRERGREKERERENKTHKLKIKLRTWQREETSSSRKTVVLVDSKFMQVPTVPSALGLITAHFFSLILNYPLPFMPIGVNFSYF